MAAKSVEGDIEFSERYDKDSDVYYVTVRTGEPSIVAHEHDDVILVEIGMFTRLPTGYRILNYSKYTLKAKVFQKLFIESCKQAGLKRLKDSKEGERRINKMLDEVTA